MDWLLRFALGLPARPTDVRQARDSVPELFTANDSKVAGDNDGPLLFIVGERFGLGLGSTSELRTRLREWLAVASEEIRREPVLAERHADVPLSQGCPLRLPECAAHKAVAGGTTRGDEPRRVDEPEPPLLFGLLLGGGDVGGVGAFLDFVRNAKWRPDPEDIRQVILTDRYLHTSEGEDGPGLGFDHLVAFLAALGLDAHSAFELLMNPGMETTQLPVVARGRRAKGVKARKLTGRDRIQKEQRLSDRLRQKFPRATIGNYRATQSFHDRLFIVRDRKGKLSGCFGPSLNALDGQSLYLLGELDDKVIRRLQKVFDR